MELCRVNVDERRNVVDEEKDLAEPRASVSPVKVHAVEHAQVYDEMPVMIIKTECDGENEITTEELQEGLTQLSGHFVTDISLLVKEEHDFVTKIEHETGEATVKRELDIGPTVLQSQSALAPLVLPLSTRAFSSDLCFGTSSADGGAAAPLCTSEFSI
ncbi:hypothetical protein EVAR_57729_1 [Eumeta japonica]|uniref:Uncharacterized protein n=1 Tax=Eumeta variegata TaxID=151549 RepID=A0A4C1YA50_EUMVA|nr:hypothetical protein EVAR_57729_1 [Eumeta japonica]